MPPLRILFVLGSMAGGGSELQVLEILRRLDRTRFQPFLYLAHKTGERLSDVPSDVPIESFWEEFRGTIRSKVHYLLGTTHIARWMHLASVMRRLQIDVVYDRTFLATLDAAGACRLRPTPRLSCCVADPKPQVDDYPMKSKRFVWWMSRRAYASATYALANSEALRTLMIDYFQLRPEKVKVFYNLLPTIRSTDGDSLRAAERNPFVIVNSGRLHEQKGQIFLLKAVDILINQRGRKIKLVILGQGGLEAEFRAFIQSHGLESCVTLAGYVADPQQWYRQAHLFVLPSLYEGMPNALIEAVSLGTPALAADCPTGPSEVLDGDRCGRLVPPGDVDALVREIEDAIDHWDEWQARAVVARERVLEMFDPTTGIRKLEALFEEIAGRPADAANDSK